jgi:glycosyltransferase involved in cell wall biosynthesis
MTEDFDVRVCLSVTKDDFNEKELNLLKVDLSRTSVGFLSNGRTFWQMFRTLRRLKPSLIHSVTVKPNLMFGILALFTRTPIIFTVPGLGTLFNYSSSSSKIVRRLVLWIYRLASLNRKSCFIFENKDDKAILSRYKICNESNSFVVPGSGVDMTRFKYRPLCENLKGPMNILFASRLLEGKGLRELIEAVRISNKVEHKWNLNVAGLLDNDSPEAITLKEIENWNDEGSINWLGPVTNMEKVILDNHIIALPSKYGEGLPRIILEANACGRTVLATDIAGCNDFIIDGFNGYLAKVNSVTSIVETLSKMESIEKLKEMGVNGKKRVEEAYTKEHVIKAYKDIYLTMMKYL